MVEYFFTLTQQTMKNIIIIIMLLTLASCIRSQKVMYADGQIVTISMGAMQGMVKENDSIWVESTYQKKNSRVLLKAYGFVTDTLPKYKSDSVAYEKVIIL